MVDTVVTALGSTVLDQISGLWGPYWSDISTGIIVYVDDGQDISFARTTDAGTNWTLTEIEAGTTKSIAAWYDKETAGNTGTLVHVVWVDDADDEFKYVNLDVADGTVGTIRIIDSTFTVDAGNPNNRVGITRTKSGNLIAAASTQTEIESYRSTDLFVADNDSIADVFEAATQEDWLLLFPANTADDDDAACFFWDRSANVISVKMFDNSADSWTETAILSGMADDQFHMNMDGACRHSDEFILGCAHSNDDTTGDDLVTWTVNPNSIASPTIDTTTANVFTDEAESAQCGMLVNQQNDDVRICWISGDPTWQATTVVVSKLSTDDMATWGTEQAYSEDAADDNRLCPAGRTVGDDGGRFQPCFFNDDLNDVFGNEVNDVEIPAAVAAGQPMMRRWGGSIARLGVPGFGRGW